MALVKLYKRNSGGKSARKMSEQPLTAQNELSVHSASSMSLLES